MNRRFQARRGVLFGRKQSLNFKAQLRIPIAGLIKQGAPLSLPVLSRAMKDVLDLAPAFRFQASTYEPSISLCNQDSAMRRSLRTVTGETAMAAAISSIESPPKYRSSITLLLRGSNLSRAVSPQSRA